MHLTRSRYCGALTVPFVVAFLWMPVLHESSAAQDSTVFVDGFFSYQSGTLARGCGDMTSGPWRWTSHHHRACHSAGWGIKEVDQSNKKLWLWGGVASGGGGDCAVCASDEEFWTLSDYSVRAKISPIRVRRNDRGCKSGLAGIQGRIQGTDAFCTGYLLALQLNNGDSHCDVQSSLQLFCNDRGGNCDGSESLTLLAEQEVDIQADASGGFDAMEVYVLKLRFDGSDIWGAVWTSQDWKAGAQPLAEVQAFDETYSQGTFGLYQGSSETLFDDVVVTLEGESGVVHPTSIVADVDFNPDRLDPGRKGRYVTCHIELPQAYDPRDINVGTILLNTSVPAELLPTDVGDYDRDGIEDRMIRFDRSDVMAAVGVANESTSGAGEGLALPSGTQDNVAMEVRGELTDGTEFAGTDTVSVGITGGESKRRAVLTWLRGPVGTTPLIGFELNADGPVSLCVYDAAGRMIRTLVKGHRQAGSYEMGWDCLTDDGRRASPGVYFVRLEQHGEVSTAKLMIVN